MKTGLLLDNCQSGRGETVPQESIDKLGAMRATCVGTLWTEGTQHAKDVYDQCEKTLDHPLYIVRVGGHKQTPEEWWQFARDAMGQVSGCVILDGRVVLAAGNEPNIEGWSNDPAGYGRFYATLNPAQSSVPILFACPSLGVTNWLEYFYEARDAAGTVTRAIVNLYDAVPLVSNFATYFSELYVGEVNRLQIPRIDWLKSAFDTFQTAGVKTATVFIAGGKSGGSWDERYIISKEEAAALQWMPKEKPMPDDPKIDQILAQNAAITNALIAFRKGNFDQGAESFDAQIIALRGGQPLDFEPVYPPKD